MLLAGRVGKPAHPNAVASVLEVSETCPMPYTFNLAQLVLDEVEVVEIGVGKGGIWRVVVEGRNRAKEVEGKVERAVGKRGSQPRRPRRRARRAEDQRAHVKAGRSSNPLTLFRLLS